MIVGVEQKDYVVFLTAHGPKSSHLCTFWADDWIKAHKTKA